MNDFRSNSKKKGSTFDDSLPGLFVQTLRVSLLANLERGVQKHLEEGQTGAFVDLASPLPVLQKKYFFFFYQNASLANSVKEMMKTFGLKDSQN